MSVGLSTIYLLIHAEVGQKAHFRGNKYTYDSVEDVSYPPAVADLTVWAALKENTKNEAFNSVIGDPFLWSSLYEDLAKYFGVEVPAEKMSFQVNPEEWAKDKKPVWQAVVKKYGGSPDAFDWCTWDMWSWAMNRDWHIWSSMAKAKKLGGTRQDYSLEVWTEAFKSFENAGVLPKSVLVWAGVKKGDGERNGL